MTLTWTRIQAALTRSVWADLKRRVDELEHEPTHKRRERVKADRLVRERTRPTRGF